MRASFDMGKRLDFAHFRVHGIATKSIRALEKRTNVNIISDIAIIRPFYLL